MSRRWLLNASVGAIVLTGVIYLTYRYSSGKRQIAPVQEAHRESDYVSPELCANCHKGIWETYMRTAMGHSFSRPKPATTIEGSKKSIFYHQASDSYFSMVEHDGKYYQRRYQVGFDGKEANVMEKQVDYVLGSGNHSRTYLHRTKDNTLIELPMAWYAEKGGSWGMNPGYDRPDHEGFRRTVEYSCMFCHNGYPEVPPGHDEPGADAVYSASLPEGIDCQRCHGPGGKHARLAAAGSVSLSDIRSAIVNPSKLSIERQAEVCMQCHLETTSSSLPHAIRRYNRGPFSYEPGEPLEDFVLNFDHAAGKGRDDKFEIVSAAYRLRRSACFRKSGGALLCTTCHNPHETPQHEDAARHFTAVCRQCHTGSFDRLVAAGKHSGSADCVGCHMPKRRTDDVVHVVMTDHYIQRRKPARDLLAEFAEKHDTGDKAYRGEVVLYYPEKLPPTPDNELYLAVAQVTQQSNLSKGVTRLAAAIEQDRPARAEFYLELAEAWRNSGQLNKALPLYEEAARRRANFVAPLRKLAVALRDSGQHARATQIFKQALDAAPGDAETWHDMGLLYLQEGRKDEAVTALQKAIELDPDMPEAFNSLGGVRLESGDRVQAESAFREAIRIQPDYAEAQTNLGNLLSILGDFRQASYHFNVALRIRPNYALARYDYAAAFVRVERLDDAQRQLEAALRADPSFAEAHELLGNLLASKGQMQIALQHYRDAVRIKPEFDRGHLSLGIALAAVGDTDEAMSHLRKAAVSSDPAVRQEALQTVQQLGKTP